MYFMSTILLKDKINGVRIPRFQLAYIHSKTHPLHKTLVKLCRKVHYMWWLNQYLELQKWKDFIKSNKTIILAITILVPKENPQGYKKIIAFNDFEFIECVTIIYCLKNMKLYVSGIC